MIRKILVPLDGSSFAEFALPVARAVARRTDAELELVMVQDPVPPFAFGEWEESPQAWREEYLEAVEDRIRPQVEGRVRHVLRVGPVPSELEEHARRAEPDLLVMATHGRGPMSRFWLGSVADHMVRHSSYPILLVRPREDEEPEVDPETGFDHVLVPLDGSREAEAILDHAFELGDAFGARYTLVRVVHYPAEIVSAYLPDTVQMSEELVEKGEAEARSYLEELAGRLAEQGRTVETDVRVDVHPASGIARSARDGGADLVALATHGRGGVRRALLGSVADKLIRSAKLPVLAYRPPGTEE